ncbi:hypothetical protein [Kitasatospora sp. NPDC093558]|uniref:hypothetical protein n=1 Tax=Kitasatospora sp. NPDC093558 TaxID=3155201 RepID=UPI00341DB001
MTNPARGGRTWPGGPLPDHHGVVVLDQEEFTRRPGATQAEAGAATGELVDEALARAGLASVRDHKLFPRDSGDGLVFGFSPEHLTALLDRFFPELQAVTAHHNTTAAGRPLRLRAAVTCGPLPADGGPDDGYGVARNEAHRLVDADALKQVMAMASPDATHLGVIVSDRVYQDVVVARYCALHPDRFLRTVATVAGKKFRVPAWIHVPAPSGGLLAAPPPPPCNPLGPAALVPVPDDDPPGRPSTTGVRGTVRTSTVQEVKQGLALANAIARDVTLSFTTTTDRQEHYR